MKITTESFNEWAKQNGVSGAAVLDFEKRFADDLDSPKDQYAGPPKKLIEDRERFADKSIASPKSSDDVNESFKKWWREEGYPNYGGSPEGTSSRAFKAGHAHAKRAKLGLYVTRETSDFGNQDYFLCMDSEGRSGVRINFTAARLLTGRELAPDESVEI